MVIFLFGASKMAEDYVAVLKKLNVDFRVICRSEESSLRFFENTQTMPLIGGIDALNDINISEADIAINAVGIEDLGSVTESLVERGFKRILVEKPAAISIQQIEKLEEQANLNNSKIFVGYNRRFFQSVVLAKKLITEDGGVKSFHFDFTEWSHEIVNLTKPDIVLDTWVAGNSSHIIDLAFFLGGKPSEVTCLRKGSLSWHKCSSIFTGAGITDSGALFSYHSNWESAGRWKLEVNSTNFKFIFEPIEKLKVMRVGSVRIEEAELLDEKIDETFKPGLYHQVKSLIDSNFYSLCKLSEQKDMLKFYFKVAGYNNE